MSADSSMNRPVTNSRLKSLSIVGFFIVFGLIVGILLWGQSRKNQQSQLDEILNQVIEQHNLSPIDLGPAQDPQQVALGQALFFDKELRHWQIFCKYIKNGTQSHNRLQRQWT